jgi:hypothetical protein
MTDPVEQRGDEASLRDETLVVWNERRCLA